MPVRESLNVLLVDGHFKSEPYQAETDYLAQALSPQRGLAGPAAADPGRGRLRVAALAVASWPPYDVVVLCNVAQFSQPEVTALEDFLKQGGGVVVFGGDQVVADNYNRLLYADGKGLLPAAIGPSVGDAAKKQAALRLQSAGLSPSARSSEYQGEADPVTAGLTQALTWQYHKLMLPQDSKAEVALAFDNGDPAVDRGAAAPRDGDPGGDLGRHGLDDLADPQELPAGHAADRAPRRRPAGSRERNIRVGQPFDQSFPAAGAGGAGHGGHAQGTVRRDQAASRPAASASSTSSRPTCPGRYQVQIGPPLALESSFAANTDPAESDLAKLDQAVLAELLPGWKFMYVIRPTGRS